MYNLSVISTFNLNLDFDTDYSCELYVDIIPESPKKQRRVLWQIEPDEILRNKNYIISSSDRFDLILTWDEDILKQCTNAKLFPFGTTWIKDFNFEEKQFCITTIIGGKGFCEGHLLRHKIPQIVSAIKNIPCDVYNSLNSPYHSEREFKYIKNKNYKNELFYSQYHIAIENVSHNNWFTEKLIDCFQTKTIPIYFGSPNISNFFDTRGMFIVNNIHDIEKICSSLNPATYSTMLEFVEKNYQTSKLYCNYKERLKTELL
jgi:hypothetical protein